MGIARVFNWFDHKLLRSPRMRVAVAQYLTSSNIERLQRSKFADQVKYVGKHSAFYREKFREHGINPARVRSHADLGNFYTTADDLKSRPIEDFLCARPEFGFETTGTSSGVNKRVYFSYDEMLDFGRDGASGLYNLGARREDIVADGFDYSFWNAPFTAYYSVMALGSFHVIGAFIEPREFYLRVKLYKPNIIMGVPTHLVRVTEVAEREGTWPVKFFLMGGENMSERTRQYVQSVWKTKVHLSYGQTEAFGLNGIECPEKGGYHVNGLTVLSEIAGADENGYGELVYSTLNRKVMPLIRYRSADITAWATDATCNCGLKLMPRIRKIVGRVDELINCSMGNISPYWFEEMLSDVKEVTQEWQVIVRRGDRDDIIEFHLEMANGASAESVKQHIFANIRERFPDCWRYYEKRFFDFDFRFHEPHTLANGRKIRRLIDARRDAWDK